MGSGSSPCASCKLLRRRCAKDCIFAPYFPPDDPHKFAIVHKVFGASNVSKMLQELPVHQRGDAVSSLVYEANARMRDPVYGCVGAISYLQNQVSHLQMQLAVAQAEILCIQMQQEPELPTTHPSMVDYDAKTLLLSGSNTSDFGDQIPQGVCLLVQLRTRCRTRLITDRLSKRLFKGGMPRIVPLYTKSRHAWDFRTRLPWLKVVFAFVSLPIRVEPKAAIAMNCYNVCLLLGKRACRCRKEASAQQTMNL
uniref:LOB domain-containing protein 12 n=1 Tax=Tanacetum cinerariifolium TaxID=118510 RepID=A0A6L2K963_TANCI|nr:LOB domain-containing protein 12 [Tanacetum cinerariifolium]